jgi:uracil-DNA glycosylase family 4
VTSSKPPSCSGCPAYSYGLGFVPPIGPKDAPVAFLGQGPGEQEAEYSVPFVEGAPAGWRLTRWIHRGGGLRDRVVLCNVVQCWLPKQRFGKDQGKGSREPTWKEMAYCWAAHVGPYLEAWARRGDGLRHIVSVGAPATRWMLGQKEGGVEKWVGTTKVVELPTIERGE